MVIVWGALLRKRRLPVFGYEDLEEAVEKIKGISTRRNEERKERGINT